MQTQRAGVAKTKYRHSVWQRSNRHGAGGSCVGCCRQARKRMDEGSRTHERATGGSGVGVRGSVLASRGGGDFQRGRYKLTAPPNGTDKQLREHSHTSVNAVASVCARTASGFAGAVGRLWAALLEQNRRPPSHNLRDKQQGKSKARRTVDGIVRNGEKTQRSSTLFCRAGGFEFARSQDSGWRSDGGAGMPCRARRLRSATRGGLLQGRAQDDLGSGGWRPATAPPLRGVAHT